MTDSELLEILHAAFNTDNNVVILDNIYCMAKRAVHDCEMDGKHWIAGSYKYIHNAISELYNEHREVKQ